MKCDNCGTTLEVGTSQCTNCGISLQANQKNSNENMMVCPSCKQENSDSAAFCKHCGLRFYHNKGGAMPYNSQPSYQMPPTNTYSSHNLHDKSYIKTSNYLLWFFLSAILIIGLICSIIFAIDKTKINRCNFFRAMLIFRVIVFIFAIFFSRFIFIAFNVFRDNIHYQIFNDFSLMF